LEKEGKLWWYISMVGLDYEATKRNNFVFILMIDLEETLKKFLF